MSDDLYDAIEQSLNKSVSDFQKELNENRKRAAAKQAQQAEEYFFALKVAQPANVKSIFRLKPNPNLEEKVIGDFIKRPNADPTKYTMAMEGKPFIAVVSMDNGLQYRAAMTRLMYIEWPQGSAHNTQITKQKLLGNNHNRPTVYADKIHYALLLWPVHKNGRVDENDFIDVRWSERDNIITLQEKEGKDSGDGIRSVDGIHLEGTAICSGSFILLNDIWGMREKYPRHFHRLFGEVQKVYDRAREQNSLGKTIYTLFEPNKPARGFGWTIPILPSDRRIYFKIPEIKIVNLNQPLKIVDRKSVPLPHRIKIDPPTQLLERVNTHE